MWVESDFPPHTNSSKRQIQNPLISMRWQNNSMLTMINKMLPINVIFFIPTLPSPFYCSGLCFFILGQSWWIKKISFCTFTSGIVFLYDPWFTTQTCQTSVESSWKRGEWKDAASIGLNSQVPGWATAAGSCGRQSCSTSIHAYSSTLPALSMCLIDCQGVFTF